MHLLRPLPIPTYSTEDRILKPDRRALVMKACVAISPPSLPSPGGVALDSRGDKPEMASLAQLRLDFFFSFLSTG